MKRHSVLFLSLWCTTTRAYRVPPSCTGNKPVCFEHGDNGALFVFKPETKKFEAICHDGWDKIDADVACKDAGFPRGALQESRDHDSRGLEISMDEFDCGGDEKSLIECKHGERHDCRSNQAAGAICDDAKLEDFERENSTLESCFASKVSFSLNDQIGKPTLRSTSVQCQRDCANNPDCVQFSYRSMSKTCHLYSASSKEPNPYEVGGPPICSNETIIQDNLIEEKCQNRTCLIGGSTEAEGNVFLEGRAVCDDHWGEKEGSVVCRELGHNGQVLRFTSASHFGPVPKPTTGETLKCNGTEESLLDCAAIASPSGMECDSGEGAGVVCDTRDAETVAEEKECFIRHMAYHTTPSRGRRLHEIEGLQYAVDCRKLCSQTRDCTHFTWHFSGGKCHLYNFTDIQDENKHQDENAVSGPGCCAKRAPTQNKSLPLKKTKEGMLLLYGLPICDDGWNAQAAHVACRQLGFSRALKASQGNLADMDVFSLDQVKCLGNETSLLECDHVDQQHENCNSKEAAGVVCDQRNEMELKKEIDRQTEECFAKAVLFGSELESDLMVLQTVLDCQDICNNTEACNTFSYDTSSKECRLQSAGEVEEAGNMGSFPSSPADDSGTLSGLELQPISATLSSSYGHYGPGYCIDGNTGGTFCHTDHDAKPWIAIDYGYGVIVERVEIFNRANCCGFRTRNVDVRISYELPTSGDEMFSGGTLLGHFAGPGTTGQHIIVSGQETSGRYVTVQMDNGGDPLNLQEVKAFGRVANFELHHETAFQSSPHHHPSKLFLDSNSTVVSGPARCPDNSSYKETVCRDKTYSGKLCLSGGENRWEGNVFYDRKPLCDDLWGMDEAQLVCKELGFGRAKNFTRNSHFGLVKGPLKEAFCKKVEHFSNCSVTSQQVCLGDEVAGVICETADEKMRREQEEEVENKCLVTGMEYVSKTLMGSTRDWKHCQQICQAEHKCTHFTFIQTSCFKSLGGAKEDNENAISGPKSCEDARSAMTVTNPKCLDSGMICLGTKESPPSPVENKMVYQGNIFYEGRPICDDNWLLVNARVVCRQLGFFGVQQITMRSHFGFTSGNFSMDNVACQGNETKISDCSYSATDDCFGGEAAGVICDTRGKEDIEAEDKTIAECYVEDVTYWGNKINASFPKVTSSPKCQEECASNSDCTHFTFWPTDIAAKFQDCSKICLRGGSGPHEGNVIVEGKAVCDFGLVSDNSRALNIGRVVCRQLGYLDVISVKFDSHFGYERGSPMRNRVFCNGDEERLQDCSYSFRPYYCGSSDAFGVICQDRQVVEGDEGLLCELYSGSEHGVNKSTAPGAITGPKMCSNITSSVCAQQPGVCLENGTSLGNGTGNVFFNGKPVCDDKWDFFAANTVCKEMNFTGALNFTIRSQFGPVPAVFSLDNVNCLGKETSLSDCFSSGVENCDGTEGAGVVCDTRGQEVVDQEDEKISTECLSDAYYIPPPESHISFNKTSNRYEAVYTDSATSCQRVCASTEGCDIFRYRKDEGICSIGELHENYHGKSFRTSEYMFGPRECNTEAPHLVSYRRENCTESGVACVAGGSGPWEGIAHLGGKPICQDGWDTLDAKVFCRQMGFRDEVSHGGNRFGDVRGPFVMNQVQCRGSESSVAECNHKSPVTNCLKWEGARVQCQQFHEADVTSIAPPATTVFGDCNDICLRGGDSSHEGNVFVQGHPVCDDGWGMEEADVACRQMGFPGAKNYTYQNYFGVINPHPSYEYDTYFSMDDVQCIGNETRLLECQHKSYHDDCGWEEGAGVICLPLNNNTTTSNSTSTKLPPSCEVTVDSGDWANSDRDEQFHMRNILYDDCDDFSYHPSNATYWLAPADTKASFVLDLGCTQVVEGLTLKNTNNAHENNRGLKNFSIAFSNSTGGPWRTVLNGSLPDARNSSCNVPLYNFSFPDNLSEEARTASALKLQVISWYEEGAGLQYFKIHIQQPTDGLGVGATVVGLTVLVVLVLALLGLAYWKRKRTRGSLRCLAWMEGKSLKSLLTRKDQCATSVKFMSRSSEEALVDSPTEDSLAEPHLEFVNFVSTANFRSEDSTPNAATESGQNC